VRRFCVTRRVNVSWRRKPLVHPVGRESRPSAASVQQTGVVGKPPKADSKAAAGSRSGWTRPTGCNPYEGAAPEETANAVAEAAAGVVLRQAEASRVRVAATNGRPSERPQGCVRMGAPSWTKGGRDSVVRSKASRVPVKAGAEGVSGRSVWTDPLTLFVEAQRVKP
jgi:hypothetical protein